MTTTPEGRAGGLVVVTGAGSGIGAAVVATLRAAGSSVLGLDREAAEGVESLDVTDAPAWASVRDRLARDGARVAGLVTCAGVTCRERVDGLDPDRLRDVLDVNVVGTLNAVQAVLPLMGEGSSIVTIGSLAATNAHYPAAYTASKWAVRGLTHAMALELAPRGIRINIVHPGYVDTAMTRSAHPDFLRASLDATPLGRPGRPEEVADVIAFLLGPASAYVTGAELSVDGGAASQAGAKPISDAMRSATLSSLPPSTGHSSTRH